MAWISADKHPVPPLEVQWHIQKLRKRNTLYLFFPCIYSLGDHVWSHGFKRYLHLNDWWLPSMGLQPQPLSWTPGSHPAPCGVPHQTPKGNLELELDAEIPALSPQSPRPTCPPVSSDGHSDLWPVKTACRLLLECPSWNQPHPHLSRDQPAPATVPHPGHSGCLPAQPLASLGGRRAKQGQQSAAWRTGGRSPGSCQRLPVPDSAATLLTWTDGGPGLAPATPHPVSILCPRLLCCSRQPPGALGEPGPTPAPGHVQAALSAEMLSPKPFPPHLLQAAFRMSS